MLFKKGVKKNKRKPLYLYGNNASIAEFPATVF
jgi:hypothetical protein